MSIKSQKFCIFCNFFDRIFRENDNLKKNRENALHFLFFLAQQCALISGSVSGSETSTTRSSEILRSQQSTSRLDDLLLMSKNTPSLHTALEIGQSAEHYDLEGQQDVAFDKYQTALGLLIPLLSKEPKSERKTLLTLEVKRWMTRAETLKDLKNLQDKVMSDTISFGENTLLDKQCSIQ